MSISSPKKGPSRLVSTLALFLFFSIAEQASSDINKNFTNNGASIPEIKKEKVLIKKETIKEISGSIDSLIHGPFTKQYKKQFLQEHLIEIAQGQGIFVLKKNSEIIEGIEQFPNDILTEDEKVSYKDFVARRTLNDEMWVNNKEERGKIAEELGYSLSNMYILHQKIGYLLQNRGSGSNFSINPQFFIKLLERKDQYDINIKKGINKFLNKHESQKKEKTKGKVIKPRLPNEKDFYRDGPETQTTNYGGVPITNLHFDWKSATDSLSKAGIKLRSTNDQEGATGEKYGNGDTCTEGITEDLLSGVKKLKELLKNEYGIDEELRSNGCIEGIGHGGQDFFTGGKHRENYQPSKIDIKRHGAGYTLDIRLKGKSGLALRKLFTGISGTVHHDGFVYIYYFHGHRSNYHLHLTILPLDIYQKLFG